MEKSTNYSHELTVKLYQHENNLYLDTLFNENLKFTSLIGSINSVKKIKYLQLANICNKIIEFKNNNILYIGCTILNKDDIAKVINENHQMKAKITKKQNIIEIVKSNDNIMLSPYLYGGKNDNNIVPQVKIKHVQLYDISDNHTSTLTFKICVGIAILGCLCLGYKYKNIIKTTIK